MRLPDFSVLYAQYPGRGGYSFYLNGLTFYLEKEVDGDSPEWKKIQERLSRESNDPSEENDDEDEYLDDDLYDLQDEDDA